MNTQLNFAFGNRKCFPWYVKPEILNPSPDRGYILLGMAIFGHFTNRLTGNSSDRLTGQNRRKKQFET